MKTGVTEEHDLWMKLRGGTFAKMRKHVSYGVLAHVFNNYFSSPNGL